ncbi:MAG: DUF2905 domain-containing protein [Proteobacteria bacterium]|nr:DUF2905 domain-containing protein [Pseudomonadota bacterium]
MRDAGRLLMILGVLLLAAGALAYWAPSLGWLGRLPGDIRIERPGMRFYFPIASCVVISVVLTLILHLIGRLR